MTKVGVLGARGRMGREVIRAIAEAEDLEVGAEVDLGNSLDALTGCDVVVDFTNPGAVMDNLRWCVSHGLNVVVGTSGFGVEEAPGISVFYRDQSGAIFHTYSCFARGLDMMNAAYHYLDLTPLGRHEEGLSYPMAWLRLRDRYEPLAGAAAGCQS